MIKLPRINTSKGGINKIPVVPRPAESPKGQGFKVNKEMIELAKVFPKLFYVKVEVASS